MKTQSLKSTMAVAMVMACTVLLGQTVKESTAPLSKKAQKGYMDETTFAENGNLNVTYKIGGDKKKNEIFYEQNTFDSNLKFLETKSANEPKVQNLPDKTVKYMSAWVGGSTSFDVLSMKLKVNVTEETQEWDYKRQRYVTKKVISNETVKLKSESGRSYLGIDQYWSEETGNLIVLAFYETKDKTNPKQYVLLTIDSDGGVKEKNLDVSGAYSMVFCQEISEAAPDKSVGKQDIVLIMAPKRGNGDPTKYIYLHYSINGTLKNKIEFDSPSPNLLVNSIDVKNGDVFLSGLSTKKKEAYGDIFADYAAIEGVGMTSGDRNYQMIKYNNSALQEMDFFHMLKFNGNKIVFATTASVDEFKGKKKTAPGEKGGKIYKGSKFKIMNFQVTAANEYLIAGQLMSRNTLGPVYGDVVCFHFDSQGKLKAQYAVDKIFEDKPSEIFSMPQAFYLSGDGKYAYWEISEVKGISGYASFTDAYNGNKTFYPRYFPRITKIDLQSATLGEFIIPGQKKFFFYEDGRFFNSQTLTATYVGRDEDNENLWVSKVVFE